MILVTVGSTYYPFDRLVRAVERLSVHEEIVVQHGTSAVRPVRATCVDFLPFEAFVDHVRSAHTVITHGGVGSIMVALANGKRPLVVPRLRRFGEAVDDHQVGSVRKLEEAGLVTMVEDPDRLAERLATRAEQPLPAMLGGGPLVDELRSYLTICIGGSGGMAGGPRVTGASKIDV
jgi:beta-1,4-N-acetylglucosaminyltransferase